MMTRKTAERFTGVSPQMKEKTTLCHSFGTQHTDSKLHNAYSTYRHVYVLVIFFFFSFFFAL